MSHYYIEDFDADEQIEAEEEIAALLHDDFDVPEDTAQAASQSVLLAVLTRFRPDLVE